MEIATFIISIISLIIIPVILVLLNLRMSKSLEENKIRIEYKVQTYNKLFEVFNDVMAKNNKKYWNVSTRINLVTDLIKYAPDSIVKKYIEFWENAKTGDMKNVDLSILFEDVLLLVRKDLGYKKTKINKHDIVNMLISDK